MVFQKWFITKDTKDIMNEASNILSQQITNKKLRILIQHSTYPHVGRSGRELLMVAEWRRHNRGAMAPMKIFLSVAANGATVFSTMTFHRGTRISKEGPSLPSSPPASRALASLTQIFLFAGRLDCR